MISRAKSVECLQKFWNSACKREINMKHEPKRRCAFIWNNLQVNSKKKRQKSERGQPFPNFWEKKNKRLKKSNGQNRKWSGVTLMSLSRYRMVVNNGERSASVRQEQSQTTARRAPPKQTFLELENHIPRQLRPHGRRPVRLAENHVEIVDNLPNHWGHHTVVTSCGVCLQGKSPENVWALSYSRR